MPQFLELLLCDMQFPSGIEIDRFDEEVGMDVLTVCVGADQNFVSLIVLGQLQRGRVSGDRVDCFAFREALYHVIEQYTVRLVVEPLGGHEIRVDRFRLTVDTCDQLLPLELGLFILHGIPHHGAHASGGLAPLVVCEADDSHTGDLSRLEDGTWQQAADCIPCTPLVEREAHALLLLDGSGRRLLFDAVFPVLHGKNGEDGTVQGLFELAGVPVIGCGTLSSALCMDKDRAHQLAALAGIRVPRSHVFHSSDDFSRIAQAAEELGYPVFVKPVRAGSSFGITKVSGPEELPAAMEEAFRHDSAVILEETIPGFEVGCAVMGNEELTVGLVDEIALSEGFFNYEEKYTLKTSAIHCPARIPPEKAAEIQAAAKTIYRALDCRVFARVDLFLTPDGEIVFNEVNTIPGFTAHSRYPSMMQGIGISFGELVTRLIELGVAG